MKKRTEPDQSGETAKSSEELREEVLQKYGQLFNVGTFGVTSPH